MNDALATPASFPRARTGALVWTGRALTGLVVAFLLFDALGKLLVLAPVLEGTVRLGYAATVIRPLGVVLGLATVLHVVPRTQVLGALLVTAYLGGATATHVRMAEPCWFPILLGVLLWAGLCLRNPRVRALVLPRSAA